jgi:hypothetical protein
MSLRIGQFNTTCHISPLRQGDAELVDRLARGRFARDLGAHLGPSLGRQPAIVRIRRLTMRVILPASELNEDALSLKWRQEFGRALFTALAYPTGAGPFEVFRAESAASFVASAIQDLLDGTAPTKWQYAEFEKFFLRGSTQAALGLICEWPQQTMAVLIELAERGVLGRLLARFDDLAMERLFTALARAPDTESETLSVADLIAAARLALEHPPEKAVALRSRAYALSLLAEAHRPRQPLPSPRIVFHALVTLAVLLNEEVFWAGIPHDEPWAQRLPANVTAILESITRDVREQMQCTFGYDVSNPMLHTYGTKIPDGPQTPGGTASPQLGELNQLLSGLRTELKAPIQPTFSVETPRSRRTEGEKISPQLAELYQLLSSLRTELKVPIQPTFSVEAPGGRRTEGEKISPQLAELGRLLSALRTELKIPLQSPRPSEVRWISSEWCGLFFLSSILKRLGWIAVWGQLTDFQVGGVGCLVAGLALAISEKFDPAVPPLDQGIALFAGYFNDPDLAHMRRVFQEFPRETRLRVLRAALLHEVVDDAAESWRGTFERLSDTVLREFTSRIRGFRQATRQSIVRNFIARPGRIRIEPGRLVVCPASNPFNVALHISGIDDPLDPPVWLGGRRIEFELGDL